MKHLIIGTAGHVDHGKTSLIKALSDQREALDRLAEEAKRGITIELGFSSLTFANGERAGIVDVPGHEKFIANMLAGAGGVDLALLVVAADEGIMPQTEEHLAILNFLGVQAGIIVISKKDLVDPEWLELVKDDVQNYCQASFLAKAPILAVSASTGEGIAELKELIQEKLQALDHKKADLAFRMPIDRVFVLAGFGTVVTGTCLSGQVQVQDELCVYPSQKLVKLRQIEVHGQKEDQVEAGQRAALNLSQIKKSELKRGDVLAAKDSLLLSRHLDCYFFAWQAAKYPIKSGSKVHVHYGSASAVAQVILYGEETVNETSYGQLIFNEDIALQWGDPLILRFYSPLELIGSAKVVDTRARRHKRSDAKIREQIQALGTKSAKARLEILIKSEGLRETAVLILGQRQGIARSDLKALLLELVEEGQIIKITAENYISKQALELFEKQVVSYLRSYHASHPLQQGVRRESIRTSLLPRNSLSFSDNLLSALIKQGQIEDRNKFIALASFKVDLDQASEQLSKKIKDYYLQAGVEPLELDSIKEQYPKQDLEAIINYLLDEKEVVRLDAKYYLARKNYEQARDQIVKEIQEAGKISLAEVRDLLQTSRKYAILILDYMDQKKITTLKEEQRYLL